MHDDPYERTTQRFVAGTQARNAAGGMYEDFGSAVRGTAYDGAIKHLMEILDSHRVNSERMGKYAEADIARQRLVEVKVHELQRHKEAMRSRQIMELLELEERHVLELQAFNEEWEERFRIFEAESDATLAALQEKHASDLRTFQTRLLVKSQLPRHSSEYFNLRKIQEHLAKQHRYEEATDMKNKGDALGAWEEEQWNAERQSEMLRGEAHYKEKLKEELDGVARRIAMKRAKMTRQRQLALEHFMMQYNISKQDLQRRHTQDKQRFDKFMSIQMRILKVQAGKPG